MRLQKSRDKDSRKRVNSMENYGKICSEMWPECPLVWQLTIIDDLGKSSLRKQKGQADQGWWMTVHQTTCF